LLQQRSFCIPKHQISSQSSIFGHNLTIMRSYDALRVKKAGDDFCGSTKLLNAEACGGRVMKSARDAAGAQANAGT
jgi:hypothetical protein